MTDAGQPTQGPPPPPPPPPGGMTPPLPPTQPPGPAYAPPAPAPGTAPAGAAPTPPDASVPPKKKRGGLIALIVALVLVCGLGGCAAVIWGIGASGKDTATIKQAETHYSAASDAVEKAGASVQTAQSAATPAEVQAAIDASNKSLRTGRDEIAAAKVSIETLKDSQGKTDYLASLAAATAAMDVLQDLLGYLGTANDMLGKVQQASAAATTANDALNSAISQANKSNYSSMESKARTASTNYARAADLFTAAHQLDPAAELDKAAAYCAKRKKQADVVIVMAGQGKAGKISAYNANVKKMNALGREAEKIGEPAIVSDPEWATKRLSVLTTQLQEQGAKADELHKKALEELGYSTQ